MSSDNLWLAKELSWLSFNERVLQEAMDKSVPLIERVRFLGIFSNNQDEFFKVRVADVKRRVLIHKEHGGDPEAEDLLHAIQDKVKLLGETFDATYRELMLSLARHNIFLIQARLREPAAVERRTRDPAASRHRIGTRDQDRAVHRLDIRVAGEGHREVELLVDDLQHLGHTRLAHGPQAVQEGATDVGAARPQRTGLEHVLAAADATVHPHLEL